MAALNLTPTVTILPRLAFGAPMPPLCEAAVNQAFKPKFDNGAARPKQ